MTPENDHVELDPSLVPQPLTVPHETASVGMALPLARAGEWQGAPLPADMLPCQLDL